MNRPSQHCENVCRAGAFYLYIFFCFLFCVEVQRASQREKKRINKFTAGRWTEHRVALLRHRSYSRARQQSGVCGRPFYFSEAWRSLIIICSLCCVRMQSNRNWDAARREKRQLKCLLCMEREGSRLWVRSGLDRCKIDDCALAFHLMAERVNEFCNSRRIKWYFNHRPN